MDQAGWLLITTAVSLAAGAVAGWVSAAFHRREARKERTRQEVLRWANPILNSVQSLESRLDNILNDGLYVMLAPEVRPKASRLLPTRTRLHQLIDPDWAVSYEYVMPSTLFHFAEYFAWVRLLLERLSFELFESQQTQERFFEAIWGVTKALSSWPKDEVVGEGHDAQVFALQQRAIGELVIDREGESIRILTYREFLDALDSDASFASLFDPLRSFLEGVTPGTKRWSRLEGTRTALQTLDHECRTLLRLDGTG